jgi:hypothetical protein
LRDVLQKAQLSLEEKYSTIKDLTAELRWAEQYNRVFYYSELSGRTARGVVDSICPHLSAAMGSLRLVLVRHATFHLSQLGTVASTYTLSLWTILH